MNLKNKVIIVTGASRGIGQEICALLGKGGANVIGVSRTKAEVTKFVKGCGCKAEWMKADVSNEKQFASVFKKTKKKFGRIDALINNAGVLFNHPKKPIEKTPIKEFDITMDVNVKGQWIGCKYFKKYAKKGIIINASSVAGVPRHGQKFLSAYNASKFAVMGLTESLADEFKSKIKVYAVAPHSVATQMSNFRGNSPVLVANKYIRILKGKEKIKSGEYVIAGTKKDANKKWPKGVPSVLKKEE